MRRLTAAAIIASVSALGGVAQAADLPFTAPPAYVVSEVHSGWYVRGDIGYQFSGSTGTTDAPFTDSSYGDVGVIDFGIGYRATGWLRGDVTSSYAFQPRFTGDTAGHPMSVTARINVVSTLFNIYADLGSWYGLTPYLGAGMGFSWMRPTEFAATTLPTGGAISSGTIDLSWDLTAGFSYALSRQFVIDTSYRFLHVGTPRTNIANFGAIDYGSMDVHEFRTGFRYMID